MKCIKNIKQFLKYKPHGFACKMFLGGQILILICTISIWVFFSLCAYRRDTTHNILKLKSGIEILFILEKQKWVEKSRVVVEFEKQWLAFYIYVSDCKWYS